MSATRFQTAASDAAKKNGGHAEAPRQGNQQMLNVVQARSAGNAPATISSTMSEHKKLAIWLDKLVEESKAKGKPVVQMVNLTPALATLLLDRNDDNRKINLRAVDTFASDIDGGRWEFNGEPIIVAENGKMNDGQHRCSAVVQADKTIDVVMVVGVTRDSRATLDQGRVRTVSDFLAMDGHGDTLVLGSAANFLWMFRKRGQIYTAAAMGGTKTEVREVAKKTKGLAKSVAIAGHKAMPVGGRAMVAFCHFVFAEKNHAAANQFVHSLMDGAGLKAGDPILYARNRLIQERGRFRSPEKAELIFKAWNAWRRGETISRVLITGGVLPVLEA